jgi:deoxyribodipyrimidine photo-lyase
MLNIVWLKRDLRLSDHEPLFNAIRSQHPTLILFIVEDCWLKAPEITNRHWQFQFDCLIEMAHKINKFVKLSLFFIFT